MPTFAITVNSAGARATAATTRRRCVIKTESGKLWVHVPFAPREVSYTGMAPEYSETKRPGRRPLVMRTGDGIPHLTIDELLFYRNGASVEPDMSTLNKIAASNERVKVTWGVIEAMVLWRIVSLDYTTALRNDSEQITQFTAKLDFEMASDPVLAPPGNITLPPGGKTVLHTVARGETIVSIAVKYYKSYYGAGYAALYWPWIAAVNNIRTPWAVKLGQRLVIPLP